MSGIPALGNEYGIKLYACCDGLEGWLHESQTFLVWSESPIILMSSSIFFVFWPLFAFGRIGLKFNSFLEHQHPGKLGEKNPEWSAWVHRLTKPSPVVILGFALLVVLSMAGYFSEGQGWWQFARFPIMGAIFTYQIYFASQIKKFNTFVEGEMEQLK